MKWLSGPAVWIGGIVAAAVAAANRSVAHVISAVPAAASTGEAAHH